MVKRKNKSVVSDPQYVRELEALRSIPSTRFQNAEHFGAEAIPRCLEALGFDRDLVSFRGPVGASDLGMDADVRRSPEAAPAVVVMAKYVLATRYEFMHETLSALDSIRTRMRYDVGVLIMRDGLVVVGPERPVSFHFEQMDLPEYAHLRNLLAVGPAAMDTSLVRQAPLMDTLDEIWAARTNDDKKKSLERFARQLFSSVPVLKVKYTNLITKTSEIDLVLEVSSQVGSHPLLNSIGRYCLIECKNWKTRIGTSEVRVFVDKIREIKSQFGILLSRQGITGRSKDAVLRLRDAYRTDGIVVVVLNDTDLNALANGSDVLAMLDARADKIIFGL